MFRVLQVLGSITLSRVVKMFTSIDGAHTLRGRSEKLKIFSHLS